jgi:hypothetical protein
MFGLSNKLYFSLSSNEGIPAIFKASLFASTNFPYLSQKRIPIGELLNSSLKLLWLFTLIPPQKISLSSILSFYILIEIKFIKFF